MRCQWCGGQLRENTTPLDENGRYLAAPQTRRLGTYGYNGDGLFCTLRCGYQFAVDLARHGVRPRETLDRIAQIEAKYIDLGEAFKAVTRRSAHQDEVIAQIEAERDVLAAALAECIDCAGEIHGQAEEAS